MQLWGYYVVLTTSIEDSFDPLFINPHCDGIDTIVEGEYRFFTLFIWAVFKPVCARFGIISSCEPSWVDSFLFLSCLSFAEGLNSKPSASVLLFCTYYTWTWSHHIRQEHVCLFHLICSSWKFLPVILEKRARGRFGSGLLWCLETAIALLVLPFLHSAQFSWFLPGQGLLAGAVSALRFGKSTSRSTIWSLIISSSKVPKSQDFTSSRRLIRYASVLSTWICSVLLPRSGSGQSTHSRRSWLLWGSCVR